MSGYGDLVNHGGQTMRCPPLFERIQHLRNFGGLDEVIEAIALVGYNNKIGPILIENCADILQMADQVGLVFDTVRTNDGGEALIDY
jgi:hypothetical protein